MKITLQQIDETIRFVANNDSGNVLTIDGNPPVPGEDKGMRPMEIMLSGIAGCSSVDVVEILKKQRQNVNDFKVEITAERAAEAPRFFKALHLHFIVTGTVKEKKLKEAIELSIHKYCSAMLSLDKNITIDYSTTILNEG
ncbi:MAG: OsmC family protein [Saprospiraceae bacterium]